MKISLFAKNHDEVFEIEEAVKLAAFQRGIEIDDENPDVILYIGGDGTFLKAVQNNLDRLDEVIFLGINTGNLGFFYDFNGDEIDELFAYLDSGSLKRRRVNLMKGEAGNSKEKFEFYALNEIRFSNNGDSLKCDVFIDDELLENFAGNELVVSSTSGSTGLNTSIGGAIINSDITAFQIAPIAPINNRIYSCLINPIIFYNNVNISLKSKKGGFVSFDYINLEEKVNYVNISRSDLYVSVFVKPNKTFISKVKESFIK